VAHNRVSSPPWLIVRPTWKRFLNGNMKFALSTNENAPRTTETLLPGLQNGQSTRRTTHTRAGRTFRSMDLPENSAPRSSRYLLASLDFSLTSLSLSSLSSSFIIRNYGILIALNGSRLQHQEREKPSQSHHCYCYFNSFSSHHHHVW